MRMQTSPRLPLAHRFDHDAEAFVKIVDDVSNGILAAHQPARLRLVHVDNWFGPKWLGFSAQLAGGDEIWMSPDQTTLPPFVPGRILAEQLWQRGDASAYEAIDAGASIHVAQTSKANLKRLATVVAPGEAIVWYSGNSATNQRGSLMAYIPSNDAYRTFYVQLLANPHWVVAQVKGMSPAKFAALVASTMA